MLIYKAYKFRLYPNNNQKVIIHKTFGCTRLVYNYYLNKRKTLYEEKKEILNSYDTVKDLPNLYTEYPFLKEVDSMSLRCSLFDLDNAYKKFFKEKIGYPKYKSKYDKNSYRTNYIKNTYKGKAYENIVVDLENKLITLPKLKQVKIRGYRNINKIEGKVVNTTVMKDANKYYVSVLYEQDINITKVVPNSVVGIDLGIKNMIITSDNNKYGNEKIIDKYEKRIKKLQKSLSKKEKKSNNYKKTKLRLQILYQKLRNARKYLIDEITKKITDTYDIIVTETLKVKEMLQNHNIAKYVSDRSFDGIIKKLKYKSEIKGKKFYQVDTYYASSQICSKCGYKNKVTLDLSVRNYICPKCHNELDRDINAAENIMFEGIKKYMLEIA